MKFGKKKELGNRSYYDVIANLLTALDVHVSKRTIGRSMDTHYASGSLLSIVHCLAEWGISAQPRKISVDRLSEVQTPALAYLESSDNDSDIVVLVNNSEQVTYVDDLAGEVQLPADEFKKIFSGIFLHPEVSKYSGEYEFTRMQEQQLANTIAKTLRLCFLFALPIAALAYVWWNDLSALVAFAIITKSFGVILCEILIRIQNGQSTSLLNRVCSPDAESGCRSLLAQPIAKPYALFSLAEIGFVFALGCLLVLCVSLATASSEIIALTILLMGGLSIPAIAHLIYVQYAIGQWCRLCLLAHTLIGLEIIVAAFVLVFSEIAFPGFKEWSIAFLGLACSAGVWLAASTDRLNTSLSDSDIALGKIISDPDNLDLFMEPIDYTLDLPYPILRSANDAKVHITVFSQLDCHHCRQIHFELGKFMDLYKDQLSVEIVLLDGNDGINKEISKILYGLSKHRSSSTSFAAYTDWMDKEMADQTQLLEWQESSGLSEPEYASSEELESIHRLIHASDVRQTPLVVIDDHYVRLEGVVAVQAIGRWLRKILSSSAG